MSKKYFGKFEIISTDARVNSITFKDEKKNILNNYLKWNKLSLENKNQFIKMLKEKKLDLFQQKSKIIAPKFTLKRLEII